MSALPPGPQARPRLQAVLFDRDPLGVLVRLRARHGALLEPAHRGARASTRHPSIQVSCGCRGIPLRSISP